jgi:hypothetical protein
MVNALMSNWQDKWRHQARILEDRQLALKEKVSE